MKVLLNLCEYEYLWHFFHIALYEPFNTVKRRLYKYGGTATSMATIKVISFSSEILAVYNINHLHCKYS